MTDLIDDIKNLKRPSRNRFYALYKDQPELQETILDAFFVRCISAAMLVEVLNAKQEDKDNHISEATLRKWLDKEEEAYVEKHNLEAYEATGGATRYLRPKTTSNARLSAIPIRTVS